MRKFNKVVSLLSTLAILITLNSGLEIKKEKTIVNSVSAKSLAIYTKATSNNQKNKNKNEDNNETKTSGINKIDLNIGEAIEEVAKIANKIREEEEARRIAEAERKEAEQEAMNKVYKDELITKFAKTIYAKQCKDFAKYAHLSLDKVDYFVQLFLEQSEKWGALGDGFKTEEEVINMLYELSTTPLQDKIDYIMKNQNLTAQQVDIICAIGTAEATWESNKYIDAYAVGSVFNNRQKSKSYPNNLYKIATSPSQFVVYQEGAYRAHLGDTNNSSYLGVIDAIYSGVSVTDYIGFRSAGTKIDGRQFVTNGNKYILPLTEKNIRFNNTIKISIGSCSGESQEYSNNNLEINYLEGVTAELYDENDNLIDSWISSDEDYVIENLKPGKYYIKESRIPEGYDTPSKVTEFEVTIKDKTLNISRLYYESIGIGINNNHPYQAKPYTKVRSLV